MSLSKKTLQQVYAPRPRQAMTPPDCRTSSGKASGPSPRPTPPVSGDARRRRPASARCIPALSLTCPFGHLLLAVFECIWPGCRERRVHGDWSQAVEGWMGAQRRLANGEIDYSRASPAMLHASAMSALVNRYLTMFANLTLNVSQFQSCMSSLMHPTVTSCLIRWIDCVD